MKIRYIEPKPKGATIYEIANLPKLGLPLLAACARDRYDDLDQRIYCELIKGVQVDWADVESADLVCISTTTNTTLEGYAYAERLQRQGHPGRVRRLARDLHVDRGARHVDYVIRREGHIGWMQLLEWMLHDGSRDELHGVAGSPGSTTRGSR